MTISQSDLDDLAVAPKRTTTDEGTVEERDAKDIQEGATFAAANSGPDDPLHGLRVSRCKPGGAV